MEDSTASSAGLSGQGGDPERQVDLDQAAERLVGLHRLLDLHSRNNQTTVANWERFAHHRSHVTALMRACGGETLAILGAGNCNDVDLSLLAEHFQEIHLVDVDREAVARARERQPAGVAEALFIHAPIDLSGCLDTLPRYRSAPPELTELAEWSKNAAARAFGAMPMMFDSVVSACILSQLMHACAVGLGVGHPGLQMIACATAVAHLRSLVKMVRPGGTALIITDVVSSASFPVERLWSESVEPLDLLAHVDRQDASFSGTGPSFLLEILTGDAEISQVLESPRLVSPWLWEFTDELSYLVYALVAKKRALP